MVQLSDETFERLQKAAKISNCQAEELAAKLLSGALATTASAALPPAYPSVALLKNDFSPLDSSRFPANTTENPTRINSLVNSDSAPAPVHSAGLVSRPTVTNQPSPEKLQRRHQLESAMRELSLLIETAEPQKKEDYLLQYALLAAELDSII